MMEDSSSRPIPFWRSACIISAYIPAIYVSTLLNSWRTPSISFNLFSMSASICSTKSLWACFIAVNYLSKLPNCANCDDPRSNFCLLSFESYSTIPCLCLNSAYKVSISFWSNYIGCTTSVTTSLILFSNFIMSKRSRCMLDSWLSR